MSLETSITALIDSNNAMAQAMEGKADEIDAKLQKLDQDVSNIIQQKMSVKYFVATWGDDTHSGSMAHPLATISKALALSVEASTVMICLGSGSDGSSNNVYEVNDSHDLSSRHVIISSYFGPLCTLMFMAMGEFITRSGGSIRIVSDDGITVDVAASRSNDALVYCYGGDVNFGGSGRVYLNNHSRALKMICQERLGASDGLLGGSVSNVSFSAVETTKSTETTFVLGDLYLGGLMTISLYSCILTGNVAIYNPARHALQIGQGNGYIITI